MRPRLNPTYAAAALVAMLAAGPAAANTLWGSTATGFARECPNGICDNAYIENLSDGGPGLSFASVAMSPAGFSGVDFSASVAFIGGLLVPELKAYASANSADRFLVSAGAVGTQAYTDADGGTVRIDVALSGSTTGSNSYATGYVAVYDATGYNPNGEIHGTRLDGTVLSLGGATSDTLSFSLDPGQSYYLEAALYASADSRSGPSIADAGHTLTLDYVVAGGVSVGLVPEPGTAALLFAGLSLTGLAARRHRSSV